MHIQQFEDKNLAHYSYAVLSECEKQIILVDPARNPQQYLDFAKENNAVITGVIETHPHADFISSHLELHNTAGATIYTSKDVNVFYPHKAFEEGQQLQLGKIVLSAINTPGHSPDSISILLEHDGKQIAVFTGDTLFIGDCGRPDLREGAGNVQAKREDLAKHMYHSLREKLMVLNDDVIVYTAHGAGTLCGKNLSEKSQSTIGTEKQTNWSLQPQTEEAFVKELLKDQPFVPQYFPFDVELNRHGAAAFESSIEKIQLQHNVPPYLDKTLWVIDVRKESNFKQGHLPHSINLMEDGKFETWLGTIIKPGEKYYLAAENKAQLQCVAERAAAIGYETAITGAFTMQGGEVEELIIDTDLFKKNVNDYTIVDVRNPTEVQERKIFENSISIPLPQLRNRVNEIPTGKPIVVHCAGGYRSAAAASLIHSTLNGTAKVFDLGEAVKQF